MSAAEIGSDLSTTTAAGASVESLKAWLRGRLRTTQLAKLPSGQLQRMLEAFEKTRFRAGDWVIRQGEPGEHYYVIASGQCEVERREEPNGVGRRLAELGPGEAFGEEALVANRQRNASVRMLTAGTLLRLPKQAFLDALRRPLVRALDYHQAHELVESTGACWLDVREEHARDMGTRSNAVQVPLAELRQFAVGAPRDRRFVLYCRNGVRSAVGAFLLAERGFDVHYLRGGLQRYDLLTAPPVPPPDLDIIPADALPRAKNRASSSPSLERRALAAVPARISLVPDLRDDTEREIEHWLQEQEALRATQGGELVSSAVHAARLRERDRASKAAARAHTQALIDELAKGLDEGLDEG
jgi:CRP-like cAMP-binding protein